MNSVLTRELRKPENSDDDKTVEAERVSRPCLDHSKWVPIFLIPCLQNTSFLNHDFTHIQNLDAVDFSFNSLLVLLS